MLNFIYSLIMIIVGFGFLIISHEFGHFILAKLNGVKVEIFSLGFGPKIFSITKGGTEYRVSWIPLGGYVKLAGEMFGEDNTGSPDEFMSKKPWQRFTVFFAGSLMNFIIAFPLIILALLIGVSMPKNVIGYLMPESAEYQAGLQAGDRITSIDGVPVSNMLDYQFEILGKPVGTKAKLEIERNGEKKDAVVTAGGVGKFKIVAKSNIVGKVEPDSPADKAGLKKGDEILSVNGDDVFAGQVIARVIADSEGKPLEMEVRRGENDSSKEIKISLTPEVLKDKKTGKVTGMPYLNMEELIGLKVKSVVPDAPADKAGIPVNANIISINNQTVNNKEELHDLLVSSQGEISLDYILDEKVTSVKFEPDRTDPLNPKIGIIIDVSDIFAQPIKGSILERAGIQGGDKLIEVNGEKVKESIFELSKPLEGMSEPEVIKFKVDRKGVTKELEVLPELKPLYYVGIVFTSDKVIDALPLGKAISMGVSKTLNMSVFTLKVLKKLVKGGDTMKNIGGPAGIFYVSYMTIAYEGFSKYIWWLWVIAINLAIFNLLPIPVLDGGFILFLLIEKIKGKPISEKTMAVCQYVGLAALLFLVVFATKNDLGNIFGVL